VLLIDDGEAEVVEAGALVEQGVVPMMIADRAGRAEGAGLATTESTHARDRREGGGLGAFRAGAEGDIEAERGEPAFALR